MTEGRGSSARSPPLHGARAPWYRLDTMAWWQLGSVVVLAHTMFACGCSTQVNVPSQGDVGAPGGGGRRGARGVHGSRDGERLLLVRRRSDRWSPPRRPASKSASCSWGGPSPRAPAIRRATFSMGTWPSTPAGHGASVLVLQGRTSLMLGTMATTALPEAQPALSLLYKKLTTKGSWDSMTVVLSRAVGTRWMTFFRSRRLVGDVHRVGPCRAGARERRSPRGVFPGPEQQHGDIHLRRCGLLQHGGSAPPASWE